MSRYARVLARVVSPPRQGPFAALDGIRGLAAVGVVVYHVAQITGFVDRWFILGQGLDKLGNFAVTIFFALSGFVLYLPYSEAIFANQPLPRTLPFLSRRARRIYPGYWMALLGWALFASASDLRAMQPVQAFFLADGYTRSSGVFSGLAVAWSLRIEIAFYLVLPLIAALVASECRHATSSRGILTRQVAGIGILVAISHAFRILVLSADLSVRQSLWLPNYLDCFAFGMLLAIGATWLEAGGSLPVGIQQFADRAWPAAIVTALLYAAAAIVDGPSTGFARGSSYAVRVIQPPLQALAALVMLVPATLGRRDQRAIRLLNRPTFAALGAISYGLYLWHTTVLDHVHTRINTGSATLDMAVITVLTTIPSMAIAVLSYRIVERPEFLDVKWWTTQWRYRMWPISAVFALIASVTVFASSSGRYVADNRFEQFNDPAQRLTRQFAIWDWTRSLGGAREDAWTGLNVLSAVPHSLGFPAWATQRLTHVMLLVAMATGAVMVLRIFRQQIGLEHFLAGTLAAFGPFSASFLLPSSLYSMAAVCPWLIVAVIRGTTERHPWRWAAIVAIIVALASNPDIPGLLYNLLAVVAASTFVVASRRASARRVVGWLSITAVLTLATSTWMLAKTYFGLSVLRGRLQESELVATAAVTSSWSESIRGLGNWLSYFAWAGNARKTATDVLLTNSLVVLATFAVPVAAFAVLALSRRRWTWFLGALAILSLTFTVGGYGDPTPTPFGGWWLGMMERVEALSSFRNTYKAGAGLVIATSILAALAVTGSRDAVARVSRRWRAVPVVISLAIVGACIAPFATTSVFEPNREAGTTPAYWSAAFEFLDRLPEQGRTLFLPATTATRYRWGFVGDDIIDAGLSRPHATATGVPSSPPIANDAVETITMLAQAPNYRPGVLGAFARRLGITEIVIRNDINWQAMRLPRPTAFDGVRTDPDFEFLAQFGDEGENTTYPGDATDDVETERGLPPIEVYRLRGSTSPVRIERPARPIVVAGSTSSWPRIWTDAAITQPIVSSGAVTDEQLRDLLAVGAGVVITDSARMRLRVLQDYEGVYSYTVNLDEELDRPPTLLYSARPEAHSFTWYPDATSISAEGIASSLVTVGRRPALAFDGDPDTSWLEPWQFARGGARLRVELRDPTALGAVSITAATLPDGTALARQVRVELDDNSTRDVVLGSDGRGSIDLTGATTSSLVIRIVGFDIGQPLVGLSEIEFAGVDLREHVHVPTDVTAHAFSDPDSQVAALVSAAPTTYLFARSTRFQISEQSTEPNLLLDEERSILRRFSVARPGGYSVGGRFRLTERVSEATIRALVGPSPERAGRSQPIDDTCRDIGIALASERADSAVQVAVRLKGTVSDLLNGREIEFAGCEPLELEVGHYRLQTARDAAVSSVILQTTDWSTIAVPSTLAAADSIVLDSGDSAASATAEMKGPSTVVLATAFDPAWSARAGSRDLGAPLPVDALNGWIVDATGPTRLTFSVSGEATLDRSAGLSMASVVACMVIAGAPRRRRRHRTLLQQLERLEIPDRPVPQRLRTRSAIIATTAAGVVSVLYVGPLGLVAVPVIATVALRLPRPERIVGLAATALLVAAAVTSIGGVPDSAMEIGLAYSRQRTLPNTLALSAVVFALHTIALRIAADRQQGEPVRGQRASSS